MSKEIFDLMAEHGRAALDDDKVYEKYNKLSGPSFSTQDLYSKALQVGYSGLSNEEKSKLDYEYSKSEASKSKSLDQVHSEMDANAVASKQMSDENKKEMSGFKGWVDYALPEIPKAGHEIIKEGLAGITSPVLGAWDKFTGKHGNIGNKEQKSYAKAVSDSYEKGIANQGVEGFVSDPLNAASILLPAAAGTKVVQAIGKAKLLGKFAPAARGVAELGAGALEGAGYSAAQGMMNDEAVDISSVAPGAILGGIGSGLKLAGKSSFPEIKSTKIDPKSVARVEEHLDEVLGYGILPSTAKGMEKQGTRRIEKLQPKYSEAVERIDKKITTPEEPMDALLQKSAREMGPEEAASYQNWVKSNPKIPLVSSIDEIGERAKQEFMDRLARRHALEATTEKMIDKDIATLIKSKAHLDKKAGKEVPEIGSVLAGGDPIRAEELTRMRQSLSNPEMYKDPVAKLAMAKKDLGSSWRDAINSVLEQDPRYASIITDKVKADYALGKSIEQISQAPGSLGGMLFAPAPFGFHIPIHNDPFLKASMLYKAGQGIQKSQAGSHYRPKKEEKDEKKK